MTLMSPASHIWHAHAKCILLGEHAVLRGWPALLAPVFAFQMTLTYEGRTTPEGDPWTTLQSTIPQGCGLGSSAAYCVLQARLQHHLGVIQEKDIYQEARHREHHFHGESSGADIAAVMADSPLVFQKGREGYPLDMPFRDRLYLIDTHERGLSTREAVQRVQTSRQEAMDRRMGEAVEAVLKAPEHLDNWAKSMNVALSCFEAWDLVTTTMQRRIADVQHHGALAVKPTGAGGGGWLLGLWKEPLTEDQERHLRCVRMG